MSQDQSSNKRIAKNTLMLYIRMLISMLVGLYTSRVVLHTLGVIDYGICGVVGGVVSMMGFLNASMSGATSRFISFELGKGNKLRVQETFSSAMVLHIVIALVIVLLAETVGLWFLCNKLVIPAERMYAANWVYQCSVISAAIGITQTPYTAVIMSREKMDIYAYLELLNVILKLVIVYILVICDYDKLKLYSLLTLAVSALIAVLYRVYCVRHYEESHFTWVLKKEYLKPMTTYSGWDLYGNLSVMVRGQGMNILQNTFFGPIVNASSTVANTVMGAVMGFTENFLTAVRPQIVKQYAAEKCESFQQLVINSSRYSFLLIIFTTLPLLVEADCVMNMWLKEVPQYAVIFCQLTIINNWISVLFRPVVISVDATGNVKLISFINGTIYISVLPISYFLLKNGFGPTTPFVLNIVLLLLGHSLFSMMALHRYIPYFDIKKFYTKAIITSFLLAGVIIPVPILVHSFLPDGLLRLISVCTASVVWSLIVIFFWGMNRTERKVAIGYIRTKIKL